MGTPSRIGGVSPQYGCSDACSLKLLGNHDLLQLTCVTSEPIIESDHRDQVQWSNFPDHDLYISPVRYMWLGPGILYGVYEHLWYKGKTAITPPTCSAMFK